MGVGGRTLALSKRWSAQRFTTLNFSLAESPSCRAWEWRGSFSILAMGSGLADHAGELDELIEAAQRLKSMCHK